MLEVHPTLRIAGEYTDNFFLTTSRTEENFRSTLGPGLIALLYGARTFGTLTTTVDLVHDTAPDSGDTVKVFPSLNASVRYSLTPRLFLTVSDTFVRSDSASTLDSSGIRRGRQTGNANSLTVAVDWIVERIAAQVYYRNALFFNEDDDNQGQNQSAVVGSRSDSVTHIVGLNGSTRIGVDYTVRAGYEFSRTENLDQGSTTVSDDNMSHTVFGSFARQFGLFTTGGVSSSYQWQTDQDARIFNVSLFGAYGVPTGLSLAGAVGYSRLESNDQDSEDAFSVNGRVSYRWARAVATVGAVQDFRQTGQQGENFGTVLSRSYFGSFLYQFTPFITGTVQASYSENEPTGVGNDPNRGTQKTLSYGGSVNWQVVRWLVASLQYTYTKYMDVSAFGQSNTSNTSGDIAENRITLNFFATF